MDFRVTTEHCRYGVRASAIIIREGKLLTYQADSQNHLVGGALKVGEASHEAIAREVQEELGIRCTVKDLMFIVENRFDYKGELHHMIEFHYQVELSETPPRTTADGTAFPCEWLPLDDLSRFDVRPAFLKEALKKWEGKPVHIQIP